MTASEAMELALVAEKTSETTPQTVVAAQRSATTSHIPQGISFREFAGTKKMPKKAAALFIGVPEAQVATASKTAAGIPTYEQFVQEIREQKLIRDLMMKPSCWSWEQ